VAELGISVVKWTTSGGAIGYTTFGACPIEDKCALHLNIKYRRCREGPLMKKVPAVRASLGELIYELFEEAKKVSPQPEEQKVMVYAALKDLLTRKVTTKHPIALQA
jgi:hypothetical protein